MLSGLKKLFSRSGKGVGVEITPQKINIAQVNKQGQQYKLIKHFSLEIPENIFEEGQLVDGPALAEVIQNTVTQSKIKAKEVATAVPMREAIIRIIPVPAELDDQELRDLVLNHEASLYLPYPREEVDLDYQKLGYFIDQDGIEKVQVLLVATRRDVTDLYVDIFKQAGLKVDILEINSFALIRTIREQLRQFGSKEAAVLVDIEFDSTEIAIIVDGVPQFSRTVPIGTYQLQNSLAQAMNLPPSRSTELLLGITIPNTPEAGGTGSTTGQTWINPGMASMLRVLGELTDELRRSINFYKNQSGDVEVVQILLAGPGSGIGQIDEFFNRKLNLPAMQIDPVNTIALKVDQEIPSVQRSELGTVLGLGIRMS
jgi:type IV pilus assembly protein PilM